MFIRLPWLSSLHRLQPALIILAAAGGCQHHQAAVLSGEEGQGSHQAQLAKFGADQYFVSGKGLTQGLVMTSFISSLNKHIPRILLLLHTVAKLVVATPGIELIHAWLIQSQLDKVCT